MGQTTDALGVIASLALVVIAIAISRWQGLGAEKSLLVSSVRAIVQLVAVGLILVPVLDADAPMTIAWAWVALMVVVATVTVRRRTARASALRPSLRTIGAAVSLPLAVSLGIVFGLSVFDLQPFTLVPVAGIVLGNTLPATVAGAVQLADLARDQRGQIEAMLALGFPATEAAREQQRGAIRTALLPQIERTNAVGLVALPGAMTGLILAGVDPLDAVLAQIVVMFLVLGSVAVTVTTIVLLTTPKIFEDGVRVRDLRSQV